MQNFILWALFEKFFGQVPWNSWKIEVWCEISKSWKLPRNHNEEKTSNCSTIFWQNIMCNFYLHVSFWSEENFLKFNTIPKQHVDKMSKILTKSFQVTLAQKWTRFIHMKSSKLTNIFAIKFMKNLVIWLTVIQFLT